MENVTTISRPYATAIFDIACSETDQEASLQFWNEVLAILKTAIESEIGQNLVAQYSNYQHQIKKFALDMLPNEYRTDYVKNFLDTLEHNSRFQYLPGIHDFYVHLRQSYDLPTPVTIVTAQELSDAQIDEIGSTVATKLGCKVQLDIEHDPSILSGIIIKTAEFAIDCSGRKTLENLGSQLNK